MRITVIQNFHSFIVALQQNKLTNVDLSVHSIEGYARRPIQPAEIIASVNIL